MTCPGDTPLHSAIRSFIVNENPVKILLERDGHRDINVRNSEGETPLLLATQNKNCSLELIQLLLEHGADVKATSPRDGNTALHRVAIMLNYVENIKLWSMIATNLLRNGSDANAKNLEGSIPLHLAAEARFKACEYVFMLPLEHKSDVNARNSKGDTPIHLYMRNERVHSFDKRRFLDIAKNLNFLVNVVNSKGETPLHLAVRTRECDLELIKMFLDLGADVSMTDATGENAYQAFCRAIMDSYNNYARREDILMSQTLLRGNLQQQINSSLHVACLFLNVESVRNLLRMGADVNAVDPFDRTPLHYAAISLTPNDEDFDNKYSTVALMLDYGADITDFLTMAGIGYYEREIPILDDIEHDIYYIERSDSNLFLNVRDIFIQHATKLLALQEKQEEQGIDAQLLSEENYQCLMMNRLHYPNKSGYPDWLPRCSEELQAMSETKIGDSGVSFYDLLVASAKETAMYAKNKGLVKVFYAKKAMFPMYQGMLDAKLARDLERRKLIESAAVFLSDTLQFADPSDEFYERTLSYCSNQDLMRIVS